MDKFVVVSEAKSENHFDDNLDEEIRKLNLDSVDDLDMEIMEIKILRDFIEKKMNQSQKMQVIELIKKGNEKYTRNKNGYFINMKNLSRDNLLKIKLLVNFTKDNMKDLIKTEEILNEEKSKIEGIDKEESWTVQKEEIDKNINFEVFSMEGCQSYIFEEYREDNSEELSFLDKDFDNEKRDNSGYKIILKKYKRKFLGNKAKILKKFRDISKNSINDRSAKNTLNQTNKKKKLKVPKELKKIEDTDTNNQEDTYEEEEIDE